METRKMKTAPDDPTTTLFLDLDGTLIGPSGEISEPVWRAAAALRTRGIPLVLCTGRPYAGVARRIAARLDPEAPHIFYRGALVLDGVDSILQARPVDAGALRTTVEAARRMGETLELYSPTEVYVDEITANCREHADALGLEPVERDLLEVVDEELVLKAHWIVEATRRRDVLEISLSGCQVTDCTSPAIPGVCFVNVTDWSATKGSAAELAAEHLGRPLSEAIAVGDSRGDLPVLEKVGRPVVMADAPAEMRQRFEVIPPVDEDGVLRVFEQWSCDHE